MDIHEEPSYFEGKITVLEIAMNVISYSGIKNFEFSNGFENSLL